MKALASYADFLFIALFTALVQVGYLARGHNPPQAFLTLSGLAVTIAAILWMVDDARRNRRIPCFDFGFLAGITLPFSLIWYLVRSRGWLRGAGVLLFLIALWLIPSIAAVITWAFLYGGG